MDARSFGSYLVDKLNEAGKVIENNLLNSAYEKIEHSHRASGMLAMGKEIAGKMESLLEDFFSASSSSSNSSDSSDGGNA